MRLIPAVSLPDPFEIRLSVSWGAESAVSCSQLGSLDLVLAVDLPRADSADGFHGGL